MNTAPVMVPIVVAPLLQPLPGEVAVADQPILLPPPATASSSPSDLLGMMMSMMESMGRLSMDQSETRIRANQEQLKEAFDEFMTKLKEAIEKAEEKRDNGGGFFGFLGDVVDAVASVVGKYVGIVAGAVADFSVDLVMSQFDLVVGLLKGENLGQLIQNELSQLGENGKVANSVQGFTEGVTKFAADLLTACHSYFAALEAGLRGENMWDAVKTQASNLWGSLKDNILENPGFWDVAGVAMKALAVGAAVASGGILTPIAVGLFVAAEANHRYGLADEMLPKNVAPWVTLGLDVGAGVMLGLAGGALDKLDELGALAQDIEGVSMLVMGGLGIARGVNTWIETRNQADELENHAEMLELMSRMSRLQRLIETLIGELEEKTDDHQRTLRGGAELYRIEGQTTLATVVRA